MSTHTIITLSNRDDTIIDDSSDLEQIGSIWLDSGDLESLTVGIYEESIPQPHFHVEVYPQTIPVSSTLVRIDEGGEYKLTYHFQNFQDQPCKVSVYKC